MASGKKDISNTEWALVIGALATADLSMFLLDFTGVGEFVDPFIDSFVFMTYTFYKQMRGIAMFSGTPSANKRLVALFATFLTGLLTDGILDFWWADGLYDMYSYKAEQALEKIESKVPGGQIVVKTMEKNGPNQKPSPVTKPNTESQYQRQIEKPRNNVVSMQPNKANEQPLEKSEYPRRDNVVTLNPPEQKGNQKKAA